MTGQNQHPLQTPELIDNTPVTTVSVNRLVKKLGELQEAAPDKRSSYTVADLKKEYAPLDTVGDLDDTEVVGQRWAAETVRDALKIQCEVVTYDERAQQALIDAKLKTGPMVASVWFSEHITAGDTVDSSFTVLVSLFKSAGKARGIPSRGEMNGEILLSPNLNDADEAALLAGATLVGAQSVFEHFAREARQTESREFFVEMPQAVGSDMVRASGSIATALSVERTP